ncbi:MAG: thymidine kinase, partial [Clostridiales Family XIII bacterium]|nr:thymidine kinase [Clostridiales Family XIII bacterium]
MAQLYYRYSTMNAGKSLELIKVAYNYEERGKFPLILTPSVDDRYGGGKIVSKAGLEREAIPIYEDTNLLKLVSEKLKEDGAPRPDSHISCVLVDEGQFLKKHHILELTEIVDGYDI